MERPTRHANLVVICGAGQPGGCEKRQMSGIFAFIK
jgi:hypothetical protein